MSDLNLQNVFLDADNFLFNCDKYDFPSKENEPEDEPAEWFNEDTLNQMLPLLDKFFSNSNENLENFVLNEFSSNENLFQEQYLSSPENSDSNELLRINEEFSENVLFTSTSLQPISKSKKNNISECETDFPSSNEIYFDAVNYIREEVIECEEISVSSSPQNDVCVLLSDSSNGADELNYISKNKIISDHVSGEVKIVYPKYGGKCLKSMINSRSKNTKFLKKLKNENVLRKEKKDINDLDFLHPRLQLTPEEKQVASKEGIKLPTHYPLTKEQERQLKRIRRKIRNKISAQVSRRRKQQYVNCLEQKLKHTSEEKVRLLKRIKSLEIQKSTLATQISKLQASLARCSEQMVKPTSCLLVLIMSLALILAPTLKNSTLMDENIAEKVIVLSDGQSSSIFDSVRSSSRNLLFSQNSSENRSDIKEEFKMITELLQKIHFSKSNLFSEFLEILRIKTDKKDSLMKNRNYSRSRKHKNFEITDYDLGALSKTMEKSEHLGSKLDMLKNKTVDVKLQEPVNIDWHVG